MYVQHRRCTYGNGATLLFLIWHTDVHVHTDSYVTTKNFEFDGLPNFRNTEKNRGHLTRIFGCKI